jgi:uncharacterized protein (UPF0332 family)
MTPEAGDYLAKGRQDLSDGREILQISLANVAARSAYFAVFHAAEAFIFEKTGRIAKTHRGVRIEFARLAKDDPRIAKTLPEFLAQAYLYKEVGDYSVDPDEIVTMQDAERAITAAANFLDCIEVALT